MKRMLVILLVFLAGANLAFAQMPPDSILSKKADTTKTILPATTITDSLPATNGKMKNFFGAAKEKTKFVRTFFNFKKNYPSPKKALILSAILPGTGQIYNKKYWKLPLVYGGLGSMIYFITFTDDQYRLYQKAYKARVDDDDTTQDIWFTRSDGVELINDAALRGRRDLFRKRREMSYIGFGLAYILVGVDAFVDAHLLRFDVSDDLTLQLQPHYEYLSSREGGMGFHLSLQPKIKSAVTYPITF